MEKPERPIKEQVRTLLVWSLGPALILSILLFLFSPVLAGPTIAGIAGGLLLCFGGLFLIRLQYSVLPAAAWKWFSVLGFGLRMVFYGLGFWILLERGANPLGILAGILLSRVGLYRSVSKSRHRG